MIQPLFSQKHLSCAAAKRQAISCEFLPNVCNNITQLRFFKPSPLLHSITQPCHLAFYIAPSGRLPLGDCAFERDSAQQILLKLWQAKRLGGWQGAIEAEQQVCFLQGSLTHHCLEAPIDPLQQDVAGWRKNQARHP